MQFEHGISFVVPAYNEEGAIAATIQDLVEALAKVDLPSEIIVVDDGSTDGTLAAAQTSGNARIIHHPVNAGYGRSIKSGIDQSKYDWIGIVDADGTYPIDHLPNLVEMMNDGFDMAVGFRANVAETEGFTKNLMRRLLISVLNFVLRASIRDPNSGFRLFRRELYDMFGPFLCNTFSFTTSLTVFALGCGTFVGFAPIPYSEREGRSKVRHFRDSLRMIQLILQGISFYNPLKFYLILIILLMVFVLCPTIALIAVEMTAFAFGYLIVGVSCTLLAGMGVMADINRIASVLKASETLPPRPGKVE